MISDIEPRVMPLSSSRIASNVDAVYTDWYKPMGNGVGSLKVSRKAGLEISREVR